MTASWQQKKIGADLVAASNQLATAKRIGNIGGPLAKSMGASMEAEARRRVKDLSDLAVKYAEKPVIAKDEEPAISWQEISAAALQLSNEDWGRFTNQREILDRIIEIALKNRSKAK